MKIHAIDLFTYDYTAMQVFETREEAEKWCEENSTEYLIYKINEEMTAERKEF